MADDEQPLRLSPALLPPPVDLLVNDQEEEEVENEDIPAPAAPSPFASGGFDIDSFTRDYLHCPSCGKYYDDPRTLPCLDSYCKECLEEKTREQMEEAEREREREGEENRESEDSDKEYNEALRTFDLSPCPSSTTGSTMSQRSTRNDDLDPVSRSNDFHCPQGCRRYTGIKFDPQNGSISGIPPSNKSLKNMVQGVQLHESLKAGAILCAGGCDKKKPAIAACSNPKCANLPLCSECVGSHLTTSEPESHLLICVNKGGEGNNNNGKKRNLRNGWRCEFHPDEVVDRYCYQHKVVICRDCHLCPQRECTPDCNNFTLLSQDCMKDEELAIAELLDRVNSLHDKIKYSIKDIDTMKKELRKNKKWAYRAIDEQYKKLVDSLRQQRRDLINKTYHVYKRKWDNLKDHQDALKRISDTFQRSVDFIGGSVNMAIPTEFMFLKESFHEGLNYLIDRYKNSYMLPSDVNQRIHLKLNDTFSMDGALGQVVGTPFIENYTLESFPNPVRSQRAYSFKIQSRDICRTEVAGNVPMLKATICSIASLEPVECFVRLNNEEGVYTVYFHPFTAGRHMISVFRHQDPLEGIPVRGCPFYIDVKP